MRRILKFGLVGVLLAVLLVTSITVVGAQGPGGTKTPTPVVKASEPMPTLFVAPSLPTPVVPVVVEARQVPEPSQGDYTQHIVLLVGVVIVFKLFKR